MNGIERRRVAIIQLYHFLFFSCTSLTMEPGVIYFYLDFFSLKLHHNEQYNDNNKKNMYCRRGEKKE